MNKNEFGEFILFILRFAAGELDSYTESLHYECC